VLQGATFLDCGSPGSCGNGDWESGPNSRKASKSTHGTHVAGIAAAATNNGKGIAGVAPDAKILPVKVLDEQGATFEDMAAGVRWATNNGADVINMSLGTTLFIGPVGPLPAGILSLLGEVSALDEAVAYAISQGVVVVAAAGNENHPLCAPPSFDPGVLCVMATDSHELPTDYTNLPVKEDQNAVAAPGGGSIDYTFFCGGGVLSTVPAGTGDPAIGETCGYPAANSYDEYNGTSMASPHVAGLAALLAALDCNASENVSLITGTARHPVLLRGTYTPLYGHGIVDAEVAAAAAEFGACENVAPVAANDTGSTAPGKLVKIGALANDTDADLDVLKIARFSSPKHGKVARTKDGSLRYRSNAGFRGTDTFRYVAADGRGGIDAASVTVTVG
jgi:subtilisin family serine protease